MAGGSSRSIPSTKSKKAEEKSPIIK